MIKKSLFEDELIHGMQRELQSYDKKQGMNSLVKAAEYLHSAMDILEEAGHSAQANKILNILGKIVLSHGDHSDKVMRMIEETLEPVEETGSEPLNVDEFEPLSIEERMKMRGKKDDTFVDDNDSQSKKDKEFYEKVMKWIKNPTAPVDPSNPKPGEEIEMQSLLHPPATPKEIEFTSLREPKQLPPGEDLVFESIAQELGLLDNNAAAGEAKPHRPKDPTKVSDRHTKGLTPEKMVKNIEQHGHPMNLADDGNVDIPQPKSFDEDWEKWKRMQEKKNPKKQKVVVMDDVPIYVDEDESAVDDLLNLEIDENPIEVMDPALGKTFEDSD
jgi:hypothetical protein